MNRKSQSESATTFSEGIIKYGNDNKKWVVKKNKNGVKRWVPFSNTTLFGYIPLTAKILAQHIGKPITIYERQSSYMWPKSRKDFDVKYKFIASGHGILKDKKYENWLKTKKPIVKKKDIFIIDGVMISKDINSTLHVSPLPEELVSTNLMNTDSFIKIK
jgi:hypothetical protein